MFRFLLPAILVATTPSALQPLADHQMVSPLLRSMGRLLRSKAKLGL